MVNLIFGFRDKNYNTLFGIPIKQALIILSLFIIPGFLIILTSNILYALISIPGIFLLIIYVVGGGNILYSIANSLIKKDSNFYTQYLTKEIKTINDSIAYTETQKFCVIKIYADSYYDKPEDVKQQVRIAFNNIIINYSSNIPKMVFRAINKKLNLIQYFDNVEQTIDISNPKYKNFFETYSNEYSTIGSIIQDHDYFVELKFSKSTKDDQIKNITNEFISSIYGYGFNINQQYQPQLLRGDRIFAYIRELIAGETEENNSTLPIVTEL
jgi:hypothetical protein